MPLQITDDAYEICPSCDSAMKVTYSFEQGMTLQHAAKLEEQGVATLAARARVVEVRCTFCGYHERRKG